ncbi:MAG: flagellar basal-body rod protein FlgF [Rhodospirillaceae bacterium]|nr:flagellar basal-body rod protein FlgF [Rhodospirillaceae bacterium]
MENTSYISLSRQAVVQRQMQVIANNVANASTPAFKSERLLFQEFVEQAGDGTEISFVQDVAVIRDLSEGSFDRTGNPLDLAISGEGYFAVETPKGTEYTRNGRFQIDGDGQLVTGSGHPLLGEGDRPIVLNPGETMIEINPDGVIGTSAGPIGRVQVVRFEDQQAMQQTEGGLFETDQAALPSPEAKVIQGMVEASNVQPIVEMTRMIDAVRGYQSTQTMVQSEHERQISTIQALTEPA